MALAVELLNIFGRQGNKPLPIDIVAPEHDILWKALKSYHENGNIVPLEEAILIDDVKTRRKFMLETLYEDPLKYLDILLLAKNNEDIETAHYATTTISHAQKEFQVSIHDLAIALENDPKNISLLNQYVETVGKYIESGLLEEHLLRDLRMVYKELLDRKLARVKNDRLTLIRKIRNSIELQDYASAFESSDLLKEYWPADEQTWIEAIRVCVEGKNKERLCATVDEIHRLDIGWTKQGKEQVNAWMKDRVL